MQIYLARVDRELLPKQKPSDKETFRDTLKLVDGAREVRGCPVVYFSRTKLKKGRYIIFYRAAWNTRDENNNYRKFGKQSSKKVYT